MEIMKMKDIKKNEQEIESLPEKKSSDSRYYDVKESDTLTQEVIHYSESSTNDDTSGVLGYL